MRETHVIRKLLFLTAGLWSGLCVASGTLSVGKEISPEDITEFFYTRENINYHASFLRYRYFLEDGRPFFYHVKREREDYGPTTEKDTVSSGTVALTPEDWNGVLELLKDGRVRKRQDSAESGSSGPWMYLYWKNDRGIQQEYAFSSYGKQRSFEEFSERLAARSGISQENSGAESSLGK